MDWHRFCMVLDWMSNVLLCTRFVLDLYEMVIRLPVDWRWSGVGWHRSGMVN